MKSVELHTLDFASAHPAIQIPNDKRATLDICNLVYFFPHRKPTNIVIKVPPDLNMICTGTEMLPRARLLRRLTAKKRRMLGTHRRMGIARGARMAILPSSIRGEKCGGEVSRAVNKNWVNVMRRPISTSVSGWPVVKPRCTVPLPGSTLSRMQSVTASVP